MFDHHTCHDAFKQLSLLLPLIIMFTLLPVDMHCQTSPLESKPTELQQTQWLEGYVVDENSSTPVPGARVTMYCLYLASKKGCEESRSTVADPAGRFVFASVVPGSYMFLAFASGYTIIQNAPVATALVLPEADRPSPKVRLTRTGRIQGRIISGDTQKPLSGITMRALFKKGSNGDASTTDLGQAQTSIDGRFTISDLPPGPYNVAAEVLNDDSQPAAGAQSGASVKRVYFPAATDIEDAATIIVPAGGSYNDVNIRLTLPRSYLISGRIINTPATASEEKLVVQVYRRSSKNDFTVQSIPVTHDRRFITGGLVPGTYRIVLVAEHALSGPLQKSNLSAHMQRVIAQETVDIGNRDLTDFVLPVPAPIRLDGDITLDAFSEFATRTVKVYLNPIPVGQLSGPSKEATVTIGESFQMEGCDPLKYSFRMSHTPGLYIEDVTFNGQSIATQPIDLSGGVGGILHIVLRSGGGEVDGVLTDAEDSQNTPDITVVLVPTEPTLASLADFPQTPVNGNSFSIKDIRPGSYQAAAIRHFRADLLDRTVSMDQVLGASRTVTVDANTVSRVQLTVIELSDQ